MKELLVQYAAYNVWANKNITDTIISLNETQHFQILQSSFPNLYATVLHMWDAESIWWQRIKLHEKLIVPSESFNPTMPEAINGLIRQSVQWEEWIIQASEMMLLHVYAYQNSKKDQFKQPVVETLLHVFNHSTYHRGQLVTMMRSLGVTDIPSTDFAVFVRKKKS